MANRMSSVTGGLGVALSVLSLHGAAEAGGPFPAHNVSLLSNVGVGDFASLPLGGNDCW